MDTVSIVNFSEETNSFNVSLCFCEIATPRVPDNLATLKLDEIQAVLAYQLRPVKLYMERKDVPELMINLTPRVRGSERVISHEGQLLTSIAIDMALTAMAKFVGQDALAGSKSALIGASIEAMHIAGAKAATCPDGSLLTIRKHVHHGSVVAT